MIATESMLIIAIGAYFAGDLCFSNRPTQRTLTQASASAFIISGLVCKTDTKEIPLVVSYISHKIGLQSNKRFIYDRLRYLFYIAGAVYQW